MEEIKVGDYVTVLQWLTQQDRSWVGDTLKVIAIDWPFMRVDWEKIIEAKRVCFGTVNLDLREVGIKKLSDEMVAL